MMELFISEPQEEPQDIQEEQKEMVNHYEQNDPPPAWPIDYEVARSSRDGMTFVKRQFSISLATDTAFRDFLEIYSGTTPTRGKGIASAIIEIFLSLGMAVISDFKVTNTIKSLRELIPNPSVRENMSNNLRAIADGLLWGEE